MSKLLRVLNVEDSEDDALLIKHLLEREDYNLKWKRVDSASAMKQALKQQNWDIIISDYSMPGFNGLAALEIVKKMGFDLPFILVSGTIGEETAVNAMKAGAHDYIMKEHLGRLAPAVERELREAKTRKKQREAEKALWESEAILTEAQRIAQLGNWQWDIKNNILSWSDGNFRIFGLSPKKFEATYEAFLNSVHPDDRQFVKDAVNRALHENKPYSIDHRIVRPDGTERIVHEQAEVHSDDTGKPIQMIGTAQDITELKQAENALRASEERFHKAFHSSPDSITITTLKDGQIIEANEGFKQLTGYTLKEVIGKTTTELKIWENQEDRSKMVKMLKEDNKINQLEIILQHRSGEQRICLLSAEIIELEGEPCLVAVTRDISERKKAEEKIKASLKEKEILLQEVHHRVKNNMQLISSLLSLQSRKIKDKRALEALKSSQNRVRSMALIHERVYQSKNFARVDFTDYAQSLTSHLFSSYGIDPKVIKLNLDIKDVFLDTNTAIPCSLVINELVTNSLKHAFPDSKKGEIKITLHQLKEKEIELVVSDNGVGMPEEVDFRNTESLGLHLVNLLAEDQLHGKINLDRKNGTHFKIRFGAK